MAAPYTPTTVPQGFGAETAINANFTAIAAALETVLNKDDATDNAMEVDLNMNGNDILNVNSLTLKLVEYTVAGVPSAAANQGALIAVTDETDGYVPAFSDGTNWRRVTDRAIIS